MTKQVEEFVKLYNQNIDWNIELLNNLDKDYIANHDYVKMIVEDGYLSDEYITEVGYDLEDAELFVCDERTLELQVRNNNEYTTRYFGWSLILTKTHTKKELSVESRIKSRS